MSNVKKDSPLPMSVSPELVGPSTSSWLQVQMASNGVIVTRRVYEDGLSVENAAVFNDPKELGEWFECWARERKKEKARG